MFAAIARFLIIRLGAYIAVASAGSLVAMHYIGQGKQEYFERFRRVVDKAGILSAAYLAFQAASGRLKGVEGIGSLVLAAIIARARFSDSKFGGGQ